MTAAVERRIDADVRKEIAALNEAPGGVKFEPRCRVCQFPQSRSMVNKMLAHAFPLTDIFETVELAINPSRAKNAKISYDSIATHARKHFNLDEPAAAAYRKILARRQAEEETVRGGVARLINAMGYLDVVAQKGYETLVKEDTQVSVDLGMEAAVKLHQLTHKDAGAQEVAELRQQLAIIKTAVKDVVPQEYWSEIVERIEDAESQLGTEADIVDVEVVDDYDDDGDEGYSPPIDADYDDPIEG